MSVFRAVGLLIAIMLIGLAMVDLRHMTAQHAHQVHKLYRKRTTLQRQLWQGRLELTALRSPGQIQQRVSKLGLQVIYPGRQTVEPAGQSATVDNPSGQAGAATDQRQ